MCEIISYFDITVTVVFLSVCLSFFLFFLPVCLSVFQVYNEQIRDLLTNSGPLAVREDSQKGVVVQGLTLHQVRLCMSLLSFEE